MKQEIIRLLERAKEDGRTIGDVLAEVRGIAEPVAAQAPIPEGQQPYPPTPAPDVQSSGEAEDSYSRAAVERAMRAAHDRGYSVGWDHGHAAQAPAAAMPDEIEGLRAHVALLKSALAQSERENDELRALAAAGDAQPAVWVAADTLNSPHPTCISSLAYMSQIDQNRGREYVPLYAAPVAAQTADDARNAAFEAVRQHLCKLQRYSFIVGPRGGVRRVKDRVGNWIEFDAVHELFDPVAVDAAMAAEIGKNMEKA